MLLTGGGAETLQDRGSLSTASNRTLHPYFNNNQHARWQEYARWYMTSWEARKIIDIPVEDALRRPVQLLGLAPDDEKTLWDAYLEFNVDRQLRRALIQERLLGGALILPIFLRPADEKTSEPLDPRSLQAGDLKALNVINVSRLSRPTFDQDPFSPDYDRITHIAVNGVNLHSTRALLLDGNALNNRADHAVLEPGRHNPCGFSESKLAPLYDLLNRVIGTQQGAFHLVNMASCLLIEVEHLRSVVAADSPAHAKMRDILEQLSIYRGALIDAKGAKVTQHNAAFGSVPELVMTFAQLLSAASDIPATRFLGQAPGGLNATGEGDRENYYDMVAAYQRLSLMPAQRRILDWLGAHLWGWRVWNSKSHNLELRYPSLKVMNEKEEAEIAKTYSDIVMALQAAQMIDAESAISELNERRVFRVMPPAARGGAAPSGLPRQGTRSQALGVTPPAPPSGGSDADRQLGAESQ